MDVGINLKEIGYLDSSRLMNMKFAKKQHCGIISFSSLKLKSKLLMQIIINNRHKDTHNRSSFEEEAYLPIPLPNILLW
jgi:hypothetical protein